MAGQRGCLDDPVDRVAGVDKGLASRRLQDARGEHAGEQIAGAVRRRGEGLGFVQRGILRFDQQVADAQRLREGGGDHHILCSQRAGGVDKADVLVPLATGQHIEFEPVGRDGIGQWQKVALDGLDHLGRDISSASVAADRVDQHLKLLARIADAADEGRCGFHLANVAEVAGHDEIDLLAPVGPLEGRQHGVDVLRRGYRAGGPPVAGMVRPDDGRHFPNVHAQTAGSKGGGSIADVTA